METVEDIVDRLLDNFNMQAAIFDLDGTLIDNNAVHLQAWKKYLENSGIEISDEAYRKHINGRTNKDALEYIYNRKMDAAEAMKYALEKESVYREIYKESIKPVDGLPEFLEALHQKNIIMAIATSGIPVNIDFMFDHLPIKKYFTEIVHSSHITHGKPHPEIYEKAASLINVNPAHCLVFEDAVVGVIAAHAAGMKVVAITTTQTKEELAEADLVISNFTPSGFPLKTLQNWQ